MDRALFWFDCGRFDSSLLGLGGMFWELKSRTTLDTGSSGV